MSSLPTDRFENLFSDFKTPLGKPEAMAEAQRCINCYDAPCIKACPTGIDIPMFIRRIGADHVKGAAKTILDSNILGLSCAQSCPVEVLCEGSCVYHELDGKPIAIGKLQRYAVESAYLQKISFYTPGKPSGKRVALVGAGPSSLACAHELRKQGHEAVIFEKTEVAGGLNTAGIAPYKMKAHTSLREIEEITKMGVEIKYGEELGRAVEIEQLIEQYDGVFLGMGLGSDSKLDIPGLDSPRVLGAVELISKIKTESRSSLEWLSETRAALVIGGGNTALDACRELKGLGVAHVAVSYRRGERDMSGYKHELKWARQEAVDFLFHTTPMAIEPAPGGRLTVKLKSGLSNQAVTLTTDLVLFATGQSKLEQQLSRVKGLKFENGRLQTDPKTGATGNPKIFAGGDLANGGMEVVNAVAEGKRAALAMHEVFGNG